MTARSPTSNLHLHVLLRREKPSSPQKETSLAKMLQMYIQGTGDAKDAVIENVGDDDDDGLSVHGATGDADDDEFREWPQFRSLRRMRTGTPYHHLEVSEKLDILEFLIDELLSVDLIANEMTKRHGTSRATTPFGRLPSNSELADMYNSDWVRGLSKGRRVDLLRWLCFELSSNMFGYASGGGAAGGKLVLP